MLALALSTLLLPGLALAAPLTARQEAGSSKIRFQSSDFCLTANPGAGGFGNGNVVTRSNCAGAADAGQYWVINRGSGSVRLAGTNFCLDAGTSPNSNGVELKIWTCYGGLTQQTWYYTDDNRIAITGGSTCLDVDGGVGKVQTWQCTTGNQNQIWSAGPPVNPPPVVSSSSVVASSSSAAPPTSTSSSSAGPGPSGVPSSSGIHPFGNEALCLSVAQPFTSGSQVLSFPCNGSPGQDWVISRGSTKVCLRANPNYCLDAGTSPNDNNVELKVWERLPVPQQQWYFTDDGRIAIEGGVTCVDIRDGSRGPGAIAQTYRCTPLNGNQFFTARTA